MAYGSVLTDTVQSSTAGTPPQFKDGNSTQIGTLCRAWVNFNGTGTVAIRGSFNVSSITDNGTGLYTVNFTNAMPDANYAVAGAVGQTGSGNAYFFSGDASQTITTTAYQAVVRNYLGSTADPQYVFVSVFR